MYIIELLYKLFQKEQRLKQQAVPQKDFVEGDVSYELCEHVFLPIDSTKEILACSKCGFIVKASELKKNKNFFMR